jgi:uncharacterized RDD family membrane protein YckC
MELYKTFWRRVAALIIDGLVMAPITGMILFMTWRGMSFGEYLFWSVLSTVVSCAYWIGMHGRYGQTLGKMAAGVKVLKMNDQPLTYGVAAARYFPFIFVGLVSMVGTFNYLSGLGEITLKTIAEGPRWSQWINHVWMIAQLITVLSNPMRRAIHDFIAGTKVIIVKTQVSTLIERQ